MSVPGATSIVPCPCATPNCVSTIFVFESVQFQNAANTVYTRKTDFNADPRNVRKGKKFVFTSDYQRMQALIGQFGVAPACQRQ